MNIKLELFGASRDFSNEGFINLNLKEKSTIRDLRTAINKFIDTDFEGNKSYKKMVNSSTFCSEKDEMVSDNYKILNNEKIAIIPPIGGG